MKKLNLINQKFGKLLVIALINSDRNGHTRFLCRCECGQETTVLSTHLVGGKIKSCGCISAQEGPLSSSWTGYGEISGHFWKNIVYSASGEKGTRTKLKINIDIRFIWKLFLKQNRQCALSGLKLTFPKNAKDKSWTASLDRIDSSKGYVRNNIQWVHKDINMMKRTYNQKYFIEMCKLIAKNNPTGCEVV